MSDNNTNLNDSVKDLKTFEAKGQTSTGRHTYAPEVRDKIVAQLNKLIDQGHKITPVKEALAKLHNVNASTIDSWRKSDKSTSALDKAKNIIEDLSDSAYFKIVEKKVKSIDDELAKFDKQVEEAQKLLADKDKLRQEIEDKKDALLPPAYKKMLKDKQKSQKEADKNRDNDNNK